MAQLLVRNLKDETVARLKTRAAAAGRSLEAEVRDLLETSAATDERMERVRRMDALRAAVGPLPADWPGAEVVIREDRDSR